MVVCVYDAGMIISYGISGLLPPTVRGSLSHGDSRPSRCLVDDTS